MPNINLRHWDTRTPLEKAVGIGEMKATSTGLLVPWRSEAGRKARTRDDVVTHLRMKGCTVTVEKDGALNITPPYPPDATPSEMARIDKIWREYIKSAL